MNKDRSTMFVREAAMYVAIMQLYTQRQQVVGCSVPEQRLHAKRFKVKQLTHRLKRKLQQGIRLKRSMGVLYDYRESV